jgi:thiamine pyrophosphokinase
VKRAVVVDGGGTPHPDVVAALPPYQLVIAVDSGLDSALSLGLRVDLVVGDLDSVSAAGLARAEADGIPVERHPAAKDATDLELGVEAALRLGATDLTVVGGGGGRLDHLLGGITFLASDELEEVVVDAYLGPAYLAVLRDGDDCEVTGRPGELISVFALGGPAEGVTLDGLRYPLRDATLWPGSTLGVSNEFARPTARILVGAGTLLVVQPERLGRAG